MVLGYGDRRAVLTTAEEAAVVPGGNGVFRATVLRAGRAVGTWKRPTRLHAPVAFTPFEDAATDSVHRALPRLTRALPS
ncbi:MAG: hypothetical protein ACK5MP_01250 [Nostocoides sp.]